MKKKAPNGLQRIFRQAKNQSPSGSQLIDEPNCKSFFRWVHLSVGGIENFQNFILSLIR
jgi:hypothetical protein